MLPVKMAPGFASAGGVVFLDGPMDAQFYANQIAAELPYGLVDNRAVAAFRSAYVAAATAADARAEIAVGLARALGKRAAEFAGAPDVVAEAELVALRALAEHLGPGAVVAEAVAAFYAIRAETGLDVAGPGPAGMA